ncbi:hypothetical protein, partial [Arthrobacter sp. DR-2P]
WCGKRTTQTPGLTCGSMNTPSASLKVTTNRSSPWANGGQLRRFARLHRLRRRPSWPGCWEEKSQR